MRKSFPLILVIGLAMSAAAQSGRRITAPPPPPPPPTQAETEGTESAVSESESASTGRLAPAVGSSSLPESVLNRKLQSLDKGNSFRLSDFAGSIVVVNLWATWCGPCRMEVPEYEQVRKEYAGRGIEFIALTVEDPSA
ncbi:MAG TPA: TlpA disulfide reductase family protein, partial [Pyrinomonadaceae bacterium]|nr:TlpA disulfide reductase family protein [Pyrinomonadaceae bacterium]